jgi:vacuolar-type H+-ATPase subunit D/Vma8
MSNLSEAVAALRQVLNVTEDVKKAGETLRELAQELREHDRRITRLEAQWDTALKLSKRRNLPES